MGGSASPAPIGMTTPATFTGQPLADRHEETSSTPARWSGPSGSPVLRRMAAATAPQVQRGRRRCSDSFLLHNDLAFCRPSGGRGSSFTCMVGGFFSPRNELAFPLGSGWRPTSCPDFGPGPYACAISSSCEATASFAQTRSGADVSDRRVRPGGLSGGGSGGVWRAGRLAPGGGGL